MALKFNGEPRFQKNTFNLTSLVSDESMMPNESTTYLIDLFGFFSLLKTYPTFLLKNFLHSKICYIKGYFRVFEGVNLPFRMPFKGNTWTHYLCNIRAIQSPFIFLLSRLGSHQISVWRLLALGPVQISWQLFQETPSHLFKPLELLRRWCSYLGPTRPM